MDSLIFVYNADSGLFNAAALRRLGHPPLIVDLLPGDDDDHLLALYRRGNGWGALAKSNFATLRFREPVYRSLCDPIREFAGALARQNAE